MNINAAIHNLVSLLSALVSFQRPDLENSIYPYCVCVPPVFISNPMVLEEAEREQTPCLLVPRLPSLHLGQDLLFQSWEHWHSNSRTLAH